jgi:hypothetical protein
LTAGALGLRLNVEIVEFCAISPFGNPQNPQKNKKEEKDGHQKNCFGPVGSGPEQTAETQVQSRPEAERAERKLSVSDHGSACGGRGISV